MSELARFFAVTVLGVILDLALALALAQGLGLPLWIAATIGFVVASCVNYVLHQTWSFRAGPRQLSAGRAARYAGTALATLAARIAVVAALGHAWGSGPALAILICGAGVSFCVNFALSKLVVFRERQAEAGAP